MLHSIDAVIDRLDEIIAEAIRLRSPAGYFPALYRRVTLSVKQGIASGKFEDPGRMEALDIHFACRYLEAWDQYRTGQPITRSWQAAFAATENWRYIVLQHLLLGMNAHISLDLGISAAAIADPGNPLSLKADFFTINRLLGNMIDDTQDRLTRFFIPLGLLDRLLGPVDESFSLFSIEYARDKAWTQALELMLAGRAQGGALIRKRDEKVAAFSGRLTRPPGWMVRQLLRTIRLSEKGNVVRRIRILNELPPALP